MKTTRIAFGILLGCCAFLNGCKTPPPKIVFLENPESLRKYELIPFQKAWKDPNTNLQSYDKIIVEPVYSSKRLKLNDMEKSNLDALLGTDKKKALQFETYTANAFRKAISADPRLKLATKPGANTMILQLALVKVVPGKPVLGAVRNIPIGKIGFIISSSAKAGAASTSSLRSSVAIEGQFLDSLTKKPIAKFADQEQEVSAILNFRIMSAYGSPEQIVDQWADLLIKSLNKKPGEKIERPSGLKLIN